MTYFDVLVIGAGIAGTGFACGLVGRGFSGGLMVIGSEEGLPYKRTELSKRLVSPVLADSFTLPEFAELVGGPVEYRSGVRVLSIDVHDRTIQTSAGEFSYGKLVLALGVRPLRPRDGAHCFLTRADARALQGLVAGSSRDIEIHGAGILGTELAEQLSRSGHRVRVRLRRPYPMYRELPPSLGLGLKTMLEDRGIRFVPESAATDPQALSICAAGSLPQTELAEAAGIRTDRGILVDAQFRTSAPDIFAIGDCAQLPDGSISHLWHAAEEQGLALAELLAPGGDLSGAADYAPQLFRTKAQLFDSMVFSIGDVHRKSGQVQEWEADGIRFWARFGASGGAQALAFLGPASKEFARRAQEAVRRAYDFPTILSTLVSKD